MQEWLIEIMNQYGYFGIALLIAVENIFPPIPSEVILTFGGFLTTYTTMNPWLVALSATIGSVIGALVLYGVGRIVDEERLKRWVSGKVGRILRIKAEDIQKAQGWFDRKGKRTVFLCRFVPIVRSLISIPAGMAKMSLPSFLLLTTVGTAIWNIVLVFLGSFAGASWETIAGYFDIYSKIALVIIGVLLLLAVFLFYKKRRKPETPDMEEKEDTSNSASE